MAVQNIWRQQAKNKELQTPEGKRKYADKKYKTALLWPIATVILLALYTVYLMNGALTPDVSTMAILIIMVIFLFYSLPQIKVAKEEREKIYKETGKELRTLRSKKRK